MFHCTSICFSLNANKEIIVVSSDREEGNLEEFRLSNNHAIRDLIIIKIIGVYKII